jgi:drug/metabolite transporter (DMT)-like permease
LNPRHPAWEAGVLPLNYSRSRRDKLIIPWAPPGFGVQAHCALRGEPRSCSNRKFVIMPSSNLFSVSLGLGSGAAWGIADFTGGLASRRTNVFGVVSFAYLAGLATMVALALVTKEQVPATQFLWWAFGAGLISGVALSAFYGGLAVGQMGVVAPVSAVLTAAIPAVYGAISEGAPKRIQLAGFALAIVSIWLISRPDGKQRDARGLVLAVLAGIGFGAYLILIRKAGTTTVFWPLAISRGTSSLSIFAVTALLGRFRAPARAHLRIVWGSGALDGAGIALFLIGARMGRLDVTAVLSSLYPALTVLLAKIYLKEEIRRLQAVGLAMAVIAVIMIAG